ncbi:MAG TPA: hypothetical protein LFW14_03505 [Rickettsia endosymbiont of Degeeriella rufa]|nr:hypothetical protein [Rickettsia endosymbiont of Degeeriella rufa]
MQELQNLSQYQKYLKKITSSKEGYKILTVMEIPFFSPDIEDYNKILQLVSDNKKNIILGTDGKDIISLNKPVIYVQGNEKGDIYSRIFIMVF